MKEVVLDRQTPIPCENVRLGISKRLYWLTWYLKVTERCDPTVFNVSLGFSWLIVC